MFTSPIKRCRTDKSSCLNFPKSAVLAGFSFFNGLDDVVDDDVVDSVGFFGDFDLGVACSFPAVVILAEVGVAVFLTAASLGGVGEALAFPFALEEGISLSGATVFPFATLVGAFCAGLLPAALLLAGLLTLLLLTLLLRALPLRALPLPDWLLETLGLVVFPEPDFAGLALSGTDLLDLRAVVSAGGAEPFFPRDFPLAVLVPSADLVVAFALAGALGEAAELAPRTLVLVGRFLGLKGIYPVNLGGL
jgi:hypothetical protein